MARAGPSNVPGQASLAHIRPRMEAPGARPVAYLAAILTFLAAKSLETMQAVGKSAPAGDRTSMTSAKRLRFGGRMRVALQELNAAAATQHEASYHTGFIFTIWTYKWYDYSKASTSLTSDLMRKL